MGSQAPMPKIMMGPTIIIAAAKSCVRIMRGTLGPITSSAIGHHLSELRPSGSEFALRSLTVAALTARDVHSHRGKKGDRAMKANLKQEAPRDRLNSRPARPLPSVQALQRPESLPVDPKAEP